MSNTQNIVVYTPVENALYNGGMMIPLIGGLAAGFVVFLLLAVAFEKITRRWSIGKLDNMLLGGFGLIAAGIGASVFHWLVI